jgi:hypothetical protein
MSKEVKRYTANVFIPGNLGPVQREVVMEDDYDALLAERDALHGAAKIVLDGLNARIDAASMLGAPVPVFEGIAELHDALQGEQP